MASRGLRIALSLRWARLLVGPWGTGSREFRGTLAVVGAEMPRAETTQAIHFRFIGPENPAPPRRAPMPRSDPAALPPLPQGGRRHPQLPSQILEPPLMRAEFHGVEPAVHSRPRQPFAHQVLLHDVLLERHRAAGRLEALGVEPSGDRRGRGAGLPQIPDPGAEELAIAELFIFLDRTPNRVAALDPPRPADRHVGPFGLSPDSYSDPFHQEADDLLPFLDRGGRGLPQAGDVPGQGLGPLALGGRHLPGSLGQEPIVLLLQLALLPQGLLPPPLQFPGHQAILRVDGTIVPGGPVGLDLSAFQPLLPVLVQSLLLPLEIGQGLLVQLPPRRLDRPQHFGCHQGLERVARQTLADRLGPLDTSLDAHIIDRFPFGMVVHAHSLTATPAIDQAAQERRAAPRGARGGRQAAVGGQPLLIRQVAFPGDVGRDRVGDHHLPLQPRHQDGTGTGSARLDASRILSSELIYITSGVVGMPEDLVEDGPAWGAPL